MNAIARRITAAATMIAAPALIAIGVAAGANATVNPTDAAELATTSISAPAPSHGKSSDAVSHNPQMKPWSIRHHYNTYIQR
ncbi:hypothetical protein [Mycolicibacterium brumae]|uniref:DUF2613 domain-containing protein n=1 Tax=Mycolicibacterium brumae TaxID=85968 RepID=A0A2G5PES7_9MYCO|nr:hypothetical protein [Mycolicibacterium brumae]MCV7191973.1 hypothetical protein [Mycolicibacterium brumae]PIB76818.1 hypothetical protein CQY22_004000 [Mycolicibacterium brumae]RWA20644.1 hypothetical protein MBRU_03010 [Mycolicibacterium brumae DSM 44177]